MIWKLAQRKEPGLPVRDNLPLKKKAIGQDGDREFTEGRNSRQSDE
jgi:hypothetical protein